MNDECNAVVLLKRRPNSDLICQSIGLSLNIDFSGGGDGQSKLKIRTTLSSTICLNDGDDDDYVFACWPS